MPSGIRRRKLAKSGFNNKVRRRARKEKQKNLDFGNPLITANWDRKLTVSQNYEKLGLTANTEKAHGGVATKDSAEIKTRHKSTPTARIVRDSEGNTRIEYSSPEDDIDAPVVPSKPKTEVVAKLEEMAKQKTSKPRVQSSEEQAWLAKLVARHGDDYKAMQWDKKLNPYQHAAGELKRRVKAFLASAH